jgi:hypothetical protein
MRALTAGVAITTLAAIGQEPGPQIFRDRTDSVALYVSVTTKDAHPVTGLTIGDFSLSVDGDIHPIAAFSNAVHPVALGIALDLNIQMNMGQGYRRSFEAADALLNSLNPDDRATVGTINELISPLTTQKDMLQAALRSTNWPALSTRRLLPGRWLDWALKQLDPVGGAAVLVMLTDGAGYESPATAARELADRMTRTNISLATISFEHAYFSREFVSTVMLMGGSASLLTADADLSTAFRPLVDEWHRTYLLGFVPSFDGKRHKISVKVNRPNAIVRARTSYIAPKLRAER